MILACPHPRRTQHKLIKRNLHRALGKDADMCTLFFQVIVGNFGPMHSSPLLPAGTRLKAGEEFISREGNGVLVSRKTMVRSCQGL